MEETVKKCKSPVDPRVCNHFEKKQRALLDVDVLISFRQCSTKPVGTWRTAWWLPTSDSCSATSS